MINIERFLYNDKEKFKKAKYLRKTVFVEEQNVPEQIEYADDEEAVYYLIYDNKYLKGTARWRETEKGIKLERFAVLPENRNKGYGTALLKKILKDIIPLNKRIYLHSQITAVSYYQKAGFVIEGEPFEEAGITHYQMTFKKRGHWK